MAERTCASGLNSSVADRKLLEAISTLVEEVSELTADRPRLAAAVHVIAGHLFERTAPEVGLQDVGSQPAPKSTTTKSTATDEPNLPRLAVPGNSTVRRPQLSTHTCENPKPRYSDVTDDDLSVMVERCRLKAEGTLWALEREERLRDGADFHEEIRPADHEIIQRAKQIPNCFLWMNQPRDDIWKKAGDFDLIADCFDALAESLAALDMSLDAGTPEQFLEAVNLTAEAQSGLRTAVSRVENYPDSDQQMAYHWLRNRASQDRFYIARFMKISDPAEPNNAEQTIAKAMAIQNTLTKANSDGSSPQEHRDVA
ncbi:MAG: hypothetical protein O2820_04605 [Planctomycetota bacterium]|nr:hypothetical protein [Planctomycetota bacterium]MDA1248486.1 hypothetical protein [Planctomycetota bacterium]